VASILVLTCYVFSVILNLANISTIAGHYTLRPCGYFHIVALFSAFNIVYFTLETLRQACFFLKESGQLLDLLPETTRDMIEVHLPALKEISVALIGLQILLLCVLTLEHRLDMSRHFYFKPKGQTCMRVFLTVSALGLVILSLTMSFLIQRTDLFWSDEDKDKIMPTIVIFVMYLMVFTVLPVFIIVIVGVVNCVSSWHSTRINRVEFYLAQSLDRKFCLWTLCLILATATNLILDMSLKINAMKDQTQLLKLIEYCLTLFQYVLLILIPFITTCVLGKRCCCWCCCKACQPPLDD